MIDYVIVSVYLLSVLLVGFYHSSRVKSVADYAVAGQAYPTPVMVATIFATIIGGASTIGVAEKFYSVGIIFFITAFGVSFRDVLTAKFIVPRMGNLSGKLSPGDIMAGYYGKPGQVITGAAVLIRCVLAVGTQISALGFLGNYLLEVPYYLSAIAAALIVIFYSAFGGIRSVTITDVIQFGVLIVAIPMVCNFGVNEVGGLSGVIKSVPLGHVSIPSDPAILLKYFSLALVFLIPDLDPPILQRLLMGRDLKQGQSAMMISGLACLPFAAVAGIIGLAALSLNPDLKPSLALPYLLNTVLPVGFKGFAIAGMLAVIMSTADSYLNIAGISLVRDIIRPLKKEKLTDQRELRLMQYATILLGIGAVGCALILPNVFELAVACLVLWKPLIFPPLLMGILGIIKDQRLFYKGLLAGISSLIIWNMFFKSWLIVDGVIVATAIHFAVLLWPSLMKKLSNFKLNHVGVTD